jgi:acyl-CoA thioesterase
MTRADMPLRAELDAHLRAIPLHATLGLRLVDWSPGRARVALAPAPEHGNLAGSVHGGVLFALADAAFEIACNAYGRLSVALETACHYSSAAPMSEPLLAVAEEVSRSRRIASYRIEVRGGVASEAAGPDDAGTLRAWYMALAFRTDRWHLGEDRWPQGWRDSH